MTDEDEALEGNPMELDENNDMVYRRDPESGKIFAGGYRVASQWLEQMWDKERDNKERDNKEREQQGGGSNSVDELFRHLVVPAGLINLQQKSSNDAFFDSTHEPLSDDIYDKLFAMVQMVGSQKKAKKTRRVAAVRGGKITRKRL
jgi:hypothetical protein